MLPHKYHCVDVRLVNERRRKSDDSQEQRGRKEEGGRYGAHRAIIIISRSMA